MLESFHFRAVVLTDKSDEIRQDQNMQRPLSFSSLSTESDEKQDIFPFSSKCEAFSLAKANTWAWFFVKMTN